METKPNLSVIIPCLNEEDYVDGVLGDLTRQQDFDDFEIIVVDSNSDDDTVAVAQTFSEELPVHTVQLQERGAARARNAGAEAAKGEYLLFLDADVRIPREFLRTLWSERERTDADMMTTRFRATGVHPFDRLFYFATSRYFEKSFGTDQPLMSGCVQFTSRIHHQAIGGYQETQAVGEDVDYSERLNEMAARPHFIRKLKVVASHRRFVRDGRLTMFLRQYQWVSGQTLGRETVDAFEFGHYDAGKKKILLRHLLTRRGVRRDTFNAIRFFIRHSLRR